MSVDLYDKLSKVSEVFVLTNTVGKEALLSFIASLSKVNRYSMLGKNGVDILEKIIQDHKQDIVFEILDNFVSALTVCGIDIDVLETFVSNHNKLFKNEIPRLVEQVEPSSEVKFYHYVFYAISICSVHILHEIQNIK